jgi:hypothetical protein
MTIFRVYYATRGAHVHCRVFSGVGDTLAQCGKLVMRVPDFKAFYDFATQSASVPFFLIAFIAEQCRDGESTTESIVADWLSLPTAMRTKERLLEILNGGA